MKLSTFNLSLLSLSLSLSLSVHSTEISAKDNLILAGKVTQFTKQLDFSSLKSKHDFEEKKQLSSLEKSQKLVDSNPT